MWRNVNRRVITSTDESLDASPTGGILPILVRYREPSTPN